MLVKKQTLYVFFLSLIVVVTAILKLDGYYGASFLRIDKILIAVFFVLILPYLKIFIKIEYFLINVVVLLFSLIALYSSKVDVLSVHGYFDQALIYVYVIVEVFLFAEYIQYSGVTRQAMKFVFYFVLAACLINDVLMFVRPGEFAPLDRSVAAGDGYLLGNKFLVSYNHLFMLTSYLWLRIKDGKHWGIGILFTTYTIFIAAYTYCTTVIIGTIFMMIFLLIKPLSDFFAKNCFNILLLLFGCNFILLLNAAVLQVPFIKSVIVDVFHESMDLTGRMEIYPLLATMFLKSPWIGFGVSNNMLACQKILGIGFANTQNGLFDNLVSHGLLGTSCMLLLVALTVHRAKGQNRAFLCLLIVYIVLSAVEVTMNQKFYIALAFTAFMWDKGESDVWNV